MGDVDVVANAPRDIELVSRDLLKLSIALEKFENSNRFCLTIVNFCSTIKYNCGNTLEGRRCDPPISLIYVVYVSRSNTMPLSCFELVTCHLKLVTLKAMTAAVIRETSAASVPFQRHAPAFPPPQNVNSAGTRESPARYFGGIIAKDAKKMQFLQYL